MNRFVKCLKYVDWNYVALMFLVLYLVESRLQHFESDHSLASNQSVYAKMGFMIAMLASIGSSAYFKYLKKKA